MGTLMGFKSGDVFKGTKKWDSNPMAFQTPVKSPVFHGFNHGKSI
jgi:hypothetical protein